MDRLTQIELFVQVAELESLTKAAEKMAMSTAAASRYLSALEDRLAARLVQRTTRRLWLTDAGRDYYQHCVVMLAGMAEAEAAVSVATVNPSGLLRVSSSLSFATLQIAPWLPEFSQLYPNLSLQIVVANRYPDFIEAGIDVAIRTREYENDSGITVRRLAETRRVLAAAPGYLAAHGKPGAPEALHAHKMLVYNFANDPFVLRLSRGAETRTIGVTSVLEANDGQVLRAAALAGLGILAQPMYIIYDDIVTGRLVPVLADWDLPRLTINLAYQSRRHQPAKIRVFTDFLVERFVRLELEERWARPSQEPGP
jgi:DNA-binding transcriptional LysR family regulator